MYLMEGRDKNRRVRDNLRVRGGVTKAEFDTPYRVWPQELLAACFFAAIGGVTQIYARSADRTFFAPHPALTN